MKKFGKLAICAACTLAIALLLTYGSDSRAQGTKGTPTPAKVDPKKAKAILKVIDPEIKAAQDALRVAKAKIEKAMANEIFDEKGKTEAAVLDALKLARDRVSDAIKSADRAQLLDRRP